MIKDKALKDRKGAAKKDAEGARAPKYFEGLGRRKTAVARVRISKGSGKVFINKRSLDDYFRLERLRKVPLAPLQALKLSDKNDVSVVVRGGGVKAQAEAIRLGLARALVSMNPNFKKRLRVLGFLTRDPRMVERKKYGYKKARRAPQWQKR